MKIKRNVSLKTYNQFGVNVQAKYFAAPGSIQEVQELITDPKYKNEKKLILGGGNNILFINDFDGLVIKPKITGKKVIKQTAEHVWIKVGAGENWDELVRWVVDQGWGGIENLVMIPGTVGGAVSQGIGAYGQEAADCVQKVEAVDLKTGEVKYFSKEDCQFGYHTSVFKEKYKNKFLITNVWFRLTPASAGYELNYDYASLKKELEGVEEPYSLKDVMEAVVRQRGKNLPDLDSYGTCGCFFTNPVVKKKKFEELKQRIADLASYPSGKSEDWLKIPAGKLVDELGWRGHWEDTVGVSEKHALCIVTRRQASGQEILDLAKKIRQDVLDNYGVELGFEVNVVNFTY